MKPRISMITLGVDDLEKSIAFYEKGLGLPRMDSPPSVAFFTLNGTWLGLFGRDSLAQDANVPCEKASFNSFALAICGRSRITPSCGSAPKTQNDRIFLTPLYLVGFSLRA